MNWQNWLNEGLDVAKVLAGRSPVGAVLTVVDAIVDETYEKGGINNETVLNTVTSMAKSKWNSLTPEKVEKIKTILEEE